MRIANVRMRTNSRSVVENGICTLFEDLERKNASKGDIIFRSITIAIDLKNMSKVEYQRVVETLNMQEKDSFSGVSLMALYIFFANIKLSQMQSNQDNIEFKKYLEENIRKCKVLTRAYLCKEFRKSQFVECLHILRRDILVSDIFHDEMHEYLQQLQGETLVFFN